MNVTEPNTPIAFDEFFDTARTTFYAKITSDDPDATESFHVDYVSDALDVTIEKMYELFNKT